MSFLSLPIKILPEPKLVFGSKGELEYFALSYEADWLGSMIHLHVRRVGEREKSLEARPYHSYLVADAPDWARVMVRQVWGV